MAGSWGYQHLDEDTGQTWGQRLLLEGNNADIFIFDFN